MQAAQTHDDATYVSYDPFDGSDCDVDIRCRTVTVLTTRKPHQCLAIAGGGDHVIPVGTRARFESALVDGKWGGYYSCTACLDGWLVDIGVK